MLSTTAYLKQPVAAAFAFPTSVPLFQIKQRFSSRLGEEQAREGNKQNSGNKPNSNNVGKKSCLEIPVRPNYIAPRFPIVLCHGLFGFDKLGPSSIPYLQIHYWGGIKEALTNLGAKVIVTKVPRTGAIQSRARALHQILETALSGSEVNLLGHSMGGLDCRYLISNLPTEKCIIRSLTTISTPHRGSPFMDWCRDNIGVGMVANSFGATTKSVDDAVDSSRQQRASSAKTSKFNRGEPKSKTLIRRDKAIMDTEGIYENTRRKSFSVDKNQSPLPPNNKKSFQIQVPIPNINLNFANLQIPNISLPNISNISLPNLNISFPSISLSSIPATTSAIIHPLTRLIIQTLDTPAYSNLTTDYCLHHFNPNTPNHPSVAYYSYGAATDLPIWSPLYFPHQIIKTKEGMNDGLVSVNSAQWGRYLQTVDCDHWDLTDRWRIKLGNTSSFDPIEFYLSVATFLATEGY